MGYYQDLLKKVGRPQSYQPKELRDKFVEYVEETINNPIQVEQLVPKGGTQKLKKVHPITIQAFCLYAGISSSTFYNYKEKEEFLEITSHIDDFIHVYLFNHAAIGEFKDNLIARKLGMADKQDMDVSMSKPINIVNPYNPNDDES